MEHGELDEAITALREAMRLEPGGTLAPRALATVYLKKAVDGLQQLHRFIDQRIVHLRNPRSVLQAFLNQGSPPMLRRHFSPNFLVSILLPTAAQAQSGPGSIYYLYEPTATYRVAGNGTNNVKLGDFPFATDKIPKLSTYPGGRQMQHAFVAGKISGTTQDFTDITLYAEQTGAQTFVTNFRGPEYIETASGYQLSNDNIDSFVSFVAFNPSTGNRTLYRYNGPLADVFTPTFQRFVSGDPRLTPIVSFPGVSSTSGWDSSGRWFFYSRPDPTNSRQLLYVYDVIDQTAKLLNDPAVSGIYLSTARVSPTELRLFAVGFTSAGLRGIVSFYPSTRQFSWVIKEGGAASGRSVHSRSRLYLPMAPSSPSGCSGRSTT